MNLPDGRHGAGHGHRQHPRVARSHEPVASSEGFWFIMSMALLVGAIVAYPMNAWLVSKSLEARHDDGAAQGVVSCRRSVSSQRSRRAGAHGGPGATDEWYGDGCSHAAAATRRRDDPDLVHRTRDRSVARIVRSGAALGSALDAHDLNKLGLRFDAR